jgi:amino acid adenylation domain-containing protein
MFERRLDSCVDDSAARFPHRPALHIGTTSWSYQELAEAKHHVAAQLAAHGFTAGSATIGLIAKKTFWSYAALLGIMESGNIYVPLGPRLPRERLRTQIALAGLAAVVVDPETTSTAEALFEGLDRRPPFVDVHANAAADQGVTHATRAEHEPRYAYLIFTSGTTGEPKGVPVTHDGACAMLDAVAADIRFTSTDRFTQFAELTWDYSIAELFWCWFAGACLYVPSPSEKLIATDFVKRHEISVWCSVPTLAQNLKLLGALPPNAFPSVRLSIFSGEACSTRLAEAWHVAAPASEILNLYGPTEASVFATWYPYDPASPPSGEILPIGRPFRGFAIRVIAGDAGAGATGAATDGKGGLFLAGPQIVPGYWRNQAATDRAFVKLPDDPDGRVWYRTGDVVRLDPVDGLVFCGRDDDQVKVRGHRIELREIESVLERVTQSDRVAVVPVDVRNGRCEQLVAYCSRNGLTEAEIKTRCRTLIPDYMVPYRILTLDTLPITANGKIDHRRLAADAAVVLTRPVAQDGPQPEHRAS